MRLFACLLIAQQATFSVQTEMVVLPVTVTDTRGQSVAGLTIDRFRVYDDGRLQPIALFRGGDVPVTVGLIIDQSQSMRSKLAATNAAIAAFARSGREDDELFVVGFNDRAELSPLPDGKPFTSDAAELAAALNAATPGGTTALYDAVAMGLRHLPAGRADRKALIVVTDGGDNSSRLKYGQVRDLARASQAVIYGIGLTGAQLQEENPNNLKRLCQDSGGIARFPAATENVGSVMMEIARDLRAQYTIGFAPAPAPRIGTAFHKVRVAVVSPPGVTLRVRTREGYSVRARR
jgi:Ca-activated chloride channel family protein